jgi:hypothetical protein
MGRDYAVAFLGRVAALENPLSPFVEDGPSET